MSTQLTRLVTLLRVLLDDHIKQEPRIEQRCQRVVDAHNSRVKAQVQREYDAALKAELERNSKLPPAERLPRSDVEKRVARVLENRIRLQLPPPKYRPEQTPWMVALPLLIRQFKAKGIGETQIREYLAIDRLGGPTISRTVSAEIAGLDHQATAEEIVLAVRKECGRGAKRLGPRLTIEGELNHPAQTGAESQLGVSLFDVGIFLENGDDLAARHFVNRFSDSKKISAKPLGKCPHDGRACLYPLPEILKDVENFRGLDVREKDQLRQHLTTRLRTPKASEKLREVTGD